MAAAVRLTFDYIGESALRLVGVRHLDKRALLSDAIDGEGQAGFWIELRDRDDRVVYRRIMDNPTTRHEGPSDERGGITNRQPVSTSGTFSVVVPEIAGARRFLVMASRPVDTPAAPMLAIDFPPTARG